MASQFAYALADESSAPAFAPLGGGLARLKTPTAMNPQYQQSHPMDPSAPTGYPLYEVSPRDFGTGGGVPDSVTEGGGELTTSFPAQPPHPRPTSSFPLDSPATQQTIHSSKNGAHAPFGYPSDAVHGSGAGEGSSMDGWGATVDAPFGLDSGANMTAFGSLPTFDQTTILAHRSSFDPPSSASSFGSERPGTAGGASALISMSRSGGAFGSPATYGLVDDGLGHHHPLAYSQQLGGDRFSNTQSGVFVGGGESSTRSSPYDGPLEPSPPAGGQPVGPQSQFAYAPQQHHQYQQQQQQQLHQQPQQQHQQHQQQRYPNYLQQFNPNRYPTPPSGLSPPSQGHPSRSPADGPSSSSTGPEHMPLFAEQHSADLSNSTAFHRRASESHLAQPSFHPAQPSPAFHSSNTPPGASHPAGHPYSTPSTTFSLSNPNSARASSSRRPSSSSSAARRPNGSSLQAHVFDPSTSSLQNAGYVGRPQQQSAQSQRMHAHPYAPPSSGGSRRRDSMGMPSSATTSSFAWDIGSAGAYAATGASSMRPQTSDGIPGSALHGLSDFPANIFYQSTNQPSSNPNQFISPSNLTGAPFTGFASTFQGSSGSEFPLQQPIFAGPAVPSSSRTGTPSGSYHASAGTPSQSRPSTAPSLGMSSTSVNPRQLLPAATTASSIPHPRPPMPAPAFHQLLTSTPQDGKSKAKSLVRDSKKDNISPVTGRPKRPRRKHEEVERLYECLASGCGKSYGTLNHLNQHILTQNHGEKRTPAEFRDLRRLWRRKRKDQNAAASAAQKANGGPPKLGGLEKRPSNATSTAGAKGPTGERRRSSASALGDDDSEDDDDDEQDDDSDGDDGSSGTNPLSSVSHPQQPSVLVPSVFASYPPGSSSVQHTPTFAYDRSSSGGHPHPHTLSGPLSPLDPLLPFFSGGPPSSTSFSPISSFSASHPHSNNAGNVNATPDFNTWAFSDPLSSSTPGSGGTPSYVRAGGSASGLVHHTGFSPLTGLGVGVGTEPPSPLDHQAISGMGRRGSSRRRGSAGVVGTIEEVGEA